MRVFSTLILLFFFTTAFAIPKKRIEKAQLGKIKEELRDSFDRNFPKSDVRAVIYSIDREQMIFSQCPDEVFPARQLENLFISATALEELGVEYRFATQLALSGTMKEGTLHGDLCIIGGGDPSLSQRDLQKLIDQLAELQIEEIEGNLLFDTSIFPEEEIQRRSDLCEVIADLSVLSSPLSLDRNALSLEITAGESIFFPPVIEQISAYQPIRVINNTYSTEKEMALEVSIEEKKEREVITINGAFPLSAKKKTYYLPLRKPKERFAEVTAENLKKRGIALKGKVLFTEAPQDCIYTSCHFSAPMTLLLKEMNRRHDHFYADSLLSLLGKEKGKQEGILHLFSLVESLDPEKAAPLFRENLVSASQIKTLLSGVRKKRNYWPEFSSSLAVKSFTVGKKIAVFRNMRVAQDEQQAVAGYLQLPSGEELVIVISVTNGSSNKWEEEICRLLVNSVPSFF